MDRSFYQKPSTPPPIRLPGPHGAGAGGVRNRHPSNDRPSVRRSLYVSSTDPQDQSQSPKHPSSSRQASNSGSGSARAAAIRLRSRSQDRSILNKNSEESNHPKPATSSNNILIELNVTDEEHIQIIELFQSTNPCDIPGNSFEDKMINVINQIRGYGNDTLFGVGQNEPLPVPIVNDSFMLLGQNDLPSFNLGTPIAQSSFCYNKADQANPLQFQSPRHTDLIHEVRTKVKEMRQLKIRKQELQYYKQRNQLLDPELLKTTMSKLHEIGITLDEFKNTQIPSQLSKISNEIETGVLIPCSIDQRAALLELLQIMFKLNDTVESTLNSVCPSGSAINQNPQSNARIVELLKKKLDEEFSQLLKSTDAVQKKLGEFISLENFYGEILSYYEIGEETLGKYQNQITDREI